MTEISQNNVEFNSENDLVTNSETIVSNSENGAVTNLEFTNSESRIEINPENRLITNPGITNNLNILEKKLCRIRFEDVTSIRLDEFNLDHPLEIFYVPGHEGHGNRSLVATIQPRNNKLQEDHRITSLSMNIGNRLKNKTIFCYNNKEKEICGPYIEWPVENYKDGYIKVQPDGNLIISAIQGNNSITVDKDRALKRLRRE